MVETPREKYQDVECWLPEEDYAKAVGQLRGAIIGLMHPLRMYGQQDYVDQVIPEILSLSEDFGLRVRGIDKPISVELMRREHERKRILERDGG
jgi:hypothetical protein